MRISPIYFATIIALIIICADQVFAQQALTDTVYLTFEEEDTSRSMTVNYHSLGLNQESNVYYDIISCEVIGCDYSYSEKGKVSTIDKIDKTYHKVKLNNLSPDTTYYFVYGSSDLGFSKEYKFRTLPDDDQTIRLVNGGDMGTDDGIPLISKSAMTNEPHAILIGGDIAYANGRVSSSHKWDTWFKIMREVMVSPAGYLTPLIVAIGNHEVNTGIVFPWSESPFYDAFFTQAPKTYYKRYLGKNTVLFVLDSGHRVKVKGKQTEWLENELQQHASYANKIAMYHFPIYPGHRSPKGSSSGKVKKYWAPLFDKYHLTLALEHHDHVMKRTKVLKNHKEASQGTLYIGDGCWGKNPRKAYPDREYLAKAVPEPHVWYLEILSGAINLTSQGEGGVLFDKVSLVNTTSETIVTEIK